MNYARQVRECLVAVDPSLHRMGYAVFERWYIIKYRKRRKGEVDRGMDEVVYDRSHHREANTRIAMLKRHHDKGKIGDAEFAVRMAEWEAYKKKTALPRKGWNRDSNWGRKLIQEVDANSDSQWQLTAWGLIKSTKNEVDKKEWVDRVDLMAERLMEKVAFMRGAIVVIELPRNFGGDIGRGAAGRNAGSILKLMFLVATLRERIRERYGLIRGRPGVSVRLAGVSQWKGNLPKTVTEKRVKRRWRRAIGKNKMDHNVVDAIGIGTWWIKHRLGNDMGDQ